MFIRIAAFLLCLACSALKVSVPSSPTPLPADPKVDADYIRSHYVKHEYRVPMRDGATLFTAVYSPKDSSVAYPIVLLRTPYSVSPYGEEVFRGDFLGSSAEMTREKFIFAYQDVRGTFMSDGDFVNMRPIIAKTEANARVDESTDAYDTIDWLIAHIPNNNGNVGIWGISYPGFYAASALIRTHPALKAVSPQAPIADWYFDDFHHHGAFFPAHAFEFIYRFGRPREALTKHNSVRFERPTEDGFEFFMDYIGPLSNIDETYYRNEIPFWNEIVDHPNYDEYWQSRNLLPHLGRTTAAVMTVGGLYDAEDLYGTFKIDQAIEEHNPESYNTLVAGPWSHGGWSRSEGTHFGDIFFCDDPSPSSYFRKEIELPFFKYHLKGGEDPGLGRAHVFETGINRWRRFTRWPPLGQTKVFYFGRARSMDVNPASNAIGGFDEYSSDPAHPVPYTDGIHFGMAKEYMIADQRFVARRPDVLVYKTDPLKEPLTVAGPLRATLFVSTTGTDADFVVKFIDEYPEDHSNGLNHFEDRNMGGYQQMVRSEIMRGRFRNSYSRPEPFEPGAILKIELELLDVLHTFKEGHRITVHIQSTWFPLADRNPQHYVANIFKAKASDFVKAVHKLYRSDKYPSNISLTVVSNLE